MYPLRQRQYSDRPPYNTGSRTGVEPRFSDLLSKSWVERELSLDQSSERACNASGAQADTAPTGGYIAWDNERVSAAYCQLGGMPNTWGHRGGGPVKRIAVCDAVWSSHRYGT